MPSADCCVCLEPLSSAETLSLPCTHVFHTACAHTWLRAVPVCPLCRLPVASDGSAAPPPSDNPPPHPHLIQSFLEAVLDFMSHPQRHARLASLDGDTPPGALSTDDLAATQRPLFVDVIIAASQAHSASASLPRSIEARFSLRAPALLPTSPSPSRAPSAAASPADHPADQHLFFYIVEVSGPPNVSAPHADRAAPLAAPPRRHSRPPRPAHSEQRARARAAPAPRPQRPPPQDPVSTVDRGRAAASRHRPSSSAPAAAAQDAAPPGAPPRRRASKFMARRTRSRENRDVPRQLDHAAAGPAPDTARDPPPQASNFATFKRWMRGSWRRSAASEPQEDTNR